MAAPLAFQSLAPFEKQLVLLYYNVIRTGRGYIRDFAGLHKRR